MTGNDDDHGRGFQPSGALGVDGRLEGPREGARVPDPAPPFSAPPEPALELDDHRGRASAPAPSLELAYERRARDASQRRPALEMRDAPAPRRRTARWLWILLLVLAALGAWKLRPTDAATFTQRARAAGQEALHEVRSGIDALRPSTDPLGKGTPASEVKPGSESGWRVRQLVGRASRGVITIISSPSGAAIRIDGEAVGNTPYAGDLTWDVGAVIELTHPGYRPWHAKIEAGKELRLDAVMRRAPTR